MMTKQLAIYGAGGAGREVAWLAESCHAEDTGAAYEVVCFIDDQPAKHGKRINSIPVVGLAEARRRFPAALLLGGVGNPHTRQILTERAAALGFGFAALVHPRVEKSRWVEIGTGTVVCAGSYLMPNIALGRHVQISLDCTIGHDVIMRDYTTLAPGVHVSGWVHFGTRVYVGTGASIINGTEDAPLIIGDDVVVGAGACVTKSVPAGQTVVGVPARPLGAPVPAQDQFDYFGLPFPRSIQRRRRTAGSRQI